MSNFPSRNLGAGDKWAREAEVRESEKQSRIELLEQRVKELSESLAAIQVPVIPQAMTFESFNRSASLGSTISAQRLLTIKAPIPPGFSKAVASCQAYTEFKADLSTNGPYRIYSFARAGGGGNWSYFPDVTGTESSGGGLYRVASIGGHAELSVSPSGDIVEVGLSAQQSAANYSTSDSKTMCYLSVNILLMA